MSNDPIHDPKGLMQDAFLIEGIAGPECRSIFLDWALGLPAQIDTNHQVQMLITKFEPTAPDDHPMLATLREALVAMPQAKRRGGRQRRLQQQSDE